MNLNKLKLVLILLVITFQVNANEKQDRLEFTFSYGAAYNTYLGDQHIFKTNVYPIFFKALEVNLDYRLSHNRFIGLGYSQHDGSFNMNDEYLFGSNSGVVLDNYRHILVNDYFEFRFRKAFENRLNLTAGLFYILFYRTHFSIDGQYEPYSLFVFWRDKPRADDFGISLALDYTIPIKDYMQLGIRTKAFFTLAGFETISLAPFIKFSF